MADSHSYINYEKLGGMRTPIYPLLIKGCYVLTGEKYYLFIIAVIQIILSFLSIIFLWKVFDMVTDKYILKALIILFYGCNIGICTWDVQILTESLAITVSVFFYM